MDLESCESGSIKNLPRAVTIDTKRHNNTTRPRKHDGSPTSLRFARHMDSTFEPPATATLAPLMGLLSRCSTVDEAATVMILHFPWGDPIISLHDLYNALGGPLPIAPWLHQSVIDRLRTRVLPTFHSLISIALFTMVLKCPDSTSDEVFDDILEWYNGIIEQYNADISVSSDEWAERLREEVQHVLESNVPLQSWAACP